VQPLMPWFGQYIQIYYYVLMYYCIILVRLYRLAVDQGSTDAQCNLLVIVINMDKEWKKI